MNLFAAFNTRTGDVIGWSVIPERAAGFVSLLDLLEATIPATVTVVHLVLDNLWVHKGKAVTGSSATHASCSTSRRFDAPG